jgi:hypothetical protein
MTMEKLTHRFIHLPSLWLPVFCDSMTDLANGVFGSSPLLSIRETPSTSRTMVWQRSINRMLADEAETRAAGRYIAQSPWIQFFRTFALQC